VCLPVIPQERHIEFIGYDRAVAVTRVPISMDGATEYSTYLTPAFGSAIEFLTVAVCVTPTNTGSGFQDCGKETLVYPQPRRLTDRRT
jgi:hypothetical protein